MKINRVDYIIINMILRICSFLTKYSENINSADIYAVGKLFENEENN